MPRPLRWLLVLALAAPAAARAQHTSYDLERLWLDPSARGSLVLGSGETLPQGGLRLAVGAGWERSPLVLLDRGALRGRGLFATGHRRGDVVRDRWMLQATLAAGLTDRLELGIRFPWILSQKGDEPSGLPPVRKELIGTGSAMARFGITQQERGSVVSTAAAFEVAAPLQRPGGDVDGDPRTLLIPRVEVGRRQGPVLVAADLGAIFRLRRLQLPEGEQLRHELTAGVVAATTTEPLRVEASLRGAFNADGLGPHGELLVGARLTALRYVELFGLAGPGLGSSPGTPTFRALLGLALRTPEPAAKPETAAATPAPPPAQPEPAAPQPEPEPPAAAPPPAAPAEPEPPAAAPPAEPPRAEIAKGKIEIREKVYFDTGKATIQARSYPLLDEVAKVITDNPQVGVIRIEGHTDNRGSPQLNRRLSLARAQAVRDYLVARGVDAARLQARGFGPDRPAQPNTTAAGREANRRVEFVIVGAGSS